MKIENTFKLKDGRTLGYAEYGDPAGFPVFGLHGTPGSRIWFTEDDPTLHQLNIRFITTDRPGYGLSDPYPNRTIVGYAQDIAHLADHLGVEKFSVMGVSGGGVFTAACAYVLPDRVVKAGLISTVNEFEKGRPPQEMNRQNKIVFNLSRKFPWLLKFMMGQQKKLLDKYPEKYMESMRTNVGHLCLADQEVMKQEGVVEVLAEHMREALRQGGAGVVKEAKLETGKWGFDASKIQVPIEIWHGVADTMAPVSSIKQLAAKLPNCQTHYLEGKGHFLTEEPSIWEEILLSVRG